MPGIEATEETASRRQGLPLGRTHWLVIQYPMVSHENLYKSNIIKTEYNIYADTYIHDKRSHEFEREQRSAMQGLEGGIGRGKCSLYL